MNPKLHTVCPAIQNNPSVRLRPSQFIVSLSGHLRGLVLTLFVFLCASLSIDVRAQGTLTNGWTHTGTISPNGDSDTWTFTANAGEAIVLRVGEITQTNNFNPRIRLMNPGAVQIGLSSGAFAAELAITPTNSGTFTVIVDDVLGTATGTYRLTLAKSPGAIFVAPGDEGGPMTNGVMHAGAIDVGDLDVWTFAATNGDNIVVRMGEIVGGSTLTPELRLYGPDGTLLSAFGASGQAAEISTRATNTGTFIVIASDFSGGFAGSGTYRLTLAKTGDPIVTSAGDEGGPMTNGVMHSGTIDVGDMDVWNFSASAGDSLVVRMGEIVNGSSLTPYLRIYGPNGALLDGFGSSGQAAEVEIRATNSGTFTVIATDLSGGFSGSGSYRLTLGRTGSLVVTSPGDEGGPMTNGVMHLATIDVGDLDVWTFAATNGDSIVVRMGESVNGSTLTPELRLYGPDGALLSSFGASGQAAEVGTRATNTGTFTVIASDFSGGFSGSGTYRLTLAKTGDPVVTIAGDEGGLMTNGVMHTGTINVGDMDVWNFNANVGDSLVVRMGESVSGSTLTPFLRIYGPNGALLDSFGASGQAAEVEVRATNTGTFTVIAADFSGGFSGSGGYRLTLGRTGSPIVTSAGDEGGLMTNGLMYTGTIDVGDLDVWSFSAASGDSIVVRMGEAVAGSTLTPELRLYGPDGALISSYGASGQAAEVTVRATNSGTFTVIASDFSGGFSGSGTYRLTLAKAPGVFQVSPGDDGGPLNGGGIYAGNLDVGDLDLWSFTACAGDIVVLQITETTLNSTLTPWIRLYGRDGALLNSVSGAATAQISRTAPADGTYTVVLADLSGGFSGTGLYTFAVNGLSTGLKVCLPRISGTNLVLDGIGGTPNSNYILYSTTNISLPGSQWTALRTNQFDQFGVFAVTNLYNPSIPQQFFRVQELQP
jgi:predicted secreted protein